VGADDGLAASVDVAGDAFEGGLDGGGGWGGNGGDGAACEERGRKQSEGKEDCQAHGCDLHGLFDFGTAACLGFSVSRINS